MNLDAIAWRAGKVVRQGNNGNEQWLEQPSTLLQRVFGLDTVEQPSLGAITFVPDSPMQP